MKKLKLLLMAFALLGGASSVWAADLPTSGSGEFFLRNVGTGNYLKGDAYYGTKVVTWNDPYAVTLTYVSENTYTMKSQQDRGNGNTYVTSGADPFVDGASANMTFTEVDAVNHYFTINNGNGNLYATEVEEDGAALYKVMAGDVSTDYAKWQIISQAELEAALSEASSSNPVDATFFIKDAGIDVYSVKAGSWTKTNVDLAGGGNAGHSAESWNKTSFNLSQTVTGLPNGKYRATCYGYYRWNNGGENNNQAAVAGHASGDEVLNAIFFAGTQETPLMSVAGDAGATAFCQTMGWADNTPNSQWQAAACFTKGYYLNTLDDVVVTDGTLNIGVRKTTQAGTDWCVFDEFKLYYLGEDLSIYETPLADAKTAASNVDQEAPMKATILSALQTAISTYGSKEFASYTTVEEITEAISALNTAANNATTSISNYEGALSILNAASTFDAAGQASYAANETVAAIQSAYNDRSLESVSSAQQTACATALSTAAKAQTTEGANMTLAIANPSFETNNFTGWTNTGNMATQGNDSFTLKDGTYYAEFWQPNGTKGVSQEITGLQSGVYRLSVASYVRGITSAKIYAGDVEKGITVGADAATYSVEFACDNNATVTIGFEAVCTGAGASWICVDNFRLTLVSSGLPDVEAVTGKMNATVAAAQTTAIETYEANRTVANYNAASAAIAAAQASKDAYAVGKAALDKVAGILENTNVYTADAYSTFNTAYTTAAGKYADGSWTSEEANAYGSTVFGTGWRTTATIDDFLISAWDVAPRTWTSYHVNTWSTIGDSGNPNFFAPCIEYWVSDNTLEDKLMTATISGKNPGDRYKVEAKVCVGVNTGVAASTAPTGVSLQLNDGEIISCSGTRTGETRFYEGDFEASGIIGMDGNLYVKLNVASTNASWVTFRNVKYTLTSAAPAATDEQKTALANAITAAEGKTLGFENGEYAPYNNVAAIEALATANAIDPATATGYAVVTATTALTSATWTANSEEVNAVYNGNFALCENDGSMTGWVTDHNEGLGGAYHARAFVLASGAGNYDYLAAFGQGDGNRSCAYFRFDGTNSTKGTKYTYGTTEGYTMPLKTNTIYKLTAQAGGWGQVDKNFQIAVVNSSNENLVAQSLKTPPTGVNAGGSVIDYEMYFVVPADGNYNLVFSNGSTDADNAVVVSNIELLSTTALVFADGSVPTYAPGTYPSVKISRELTEKRWATAVYPFSVSTTAVNDIAVLNSYNISTGELGFATADASTANEPFLMRSGADISEINLSNVAVEAIAEAPAVTKNGVASLKGTYTSIGITDAEKNYVLSNNTIYEVGPAGATINPYRAYIQMAEGASEARSLTFVIDGEATAIKGIDTDKQMGNGNVYNLKGQKVSGQLKKGVYVVDGKKVAIK